ncbi:Ig-like domain-containing protein [Sporosarcina sp. GW1-11]|uniref:Ig-like domain-containing protein n=1 Tax=Sporosarcina sp. GW1-11 TaxID=2899126 RepID=UPI00294C0252|nr:Ig-like domain-containing protein [Sporosarcina sp. GW1-11]MDV6378226.1 Ig-like domain-containing protein [Sporosarcina sp. GW1-11]
MNKPYKVLTSAALAATLVIPSVVAPIGAFAATATVEADQLVYVNDKGQSFLVSYEDYVDSLFGEGNFVTLLEGKAPTAIGVNGQYIDYGKFVDLLFDNPTLDTSALLELALEDEGNLVSGDDYVGVEFDENGNPIYGEPVDEAQVALDAATQAVNALPTVAEVKVTDEENVTAAAALVAAAKALGADVTALEAKVAALQAKIAELKTDVAVESVKAINLTTIQVQFNGDLTEDQAKKGNFSVSKGEIENVSVSGDIATLTVTGLKYGEETTVTVANPAHEATVKIPQVSELFILEVEAEKDVITSDGATNTMITVTLRDRLTGKVVEEDGVVQFQATRGGLGQTTSALQDGKATVQLTSEASATSVESFITATIADVPGAKEYVGLTNQKTIVFTPKPQEDDEGKITFVQPVFAESSQGDRFHVKFSDDISAADYKKALGAAKIAAGDFMVSVDGKGVLVKDVINLTPNTLEFILDVDRAGAFNRIEQTNIWRDAPAGNNYLRDNVIHNVSFPATVGNVVLANNDGVDFMLTDTSRPAVLGVSAKDQLEFAVRFTETVDRKTVKQDNFLLDGREIIVKADPTPQEITSAKNNNKIYVTSLTAGKYGPDEDGNVIDKRNIVTFNVHKDFALAEGEHQIQIANVGDYAQDVDPTQNKVVTDTFDFNVVADKTVPVPEIEVQSAEQWKVSFDKEVYGVTGKKIKDVFSLKSADANDTFVMTNATIANGDYIVSWIDKDGKNGGVLDPNHDASKLDGKQHFLIEFTQDWTEKYQTKTNPTKTYFASTKNPYTVTLDNVESLNGNKMAKQELDVKLIYDGESPEIAHAEQVTDNNVLTPAVRVTMTEPVKNVDTDSNPITNANNEGLTPSQDQGNVNTGVPVPTYEFVKGDKVVKATATDVSYDNYAFTLKPETGATLEAGEWTLYIRSISDDIGNVSATVSEKVTIVATEVDEQETKTQVAWAAFDDSASGNSKLLAPGTQHADKDVIYVKFTKEMKSGGTDGVSRTQNYVFMGQPLPTGSQVLKGIHGVTREWDGVTIVMPAGTWNGADGENKDFGTALNVASNIKSAEGEALTGGNEFELTDTQTGSNSLDDDLEAYYLNKDISLARSAVKGAIAKSTEDDLAVTGEDTESKPNGTAGYPNARDKGYGKINIFELDVPKNTRNFNEKVYVNGKETTIDYNGYDSTNPANSTGKAKINLAAAGFAGTAADGFIITAKDGSIIVNTRSVEDKAKPVVTEARVSDDKDKVTITFSEAVTSTNIDGFNNADFAFFGPAYGHLHEDTGINVTAVAFDVNTPNKVVLTIDGGERISDSHALSVINVKDLANNRLFSAKDGSDDVHANSVHAYLYSGHYFKKFTNGGAGVDDIVNENVKDFQILLTQADNKANTDGYSDTDAINLINQARTAYNNLGADQVDVPATDLNTLNVLEAAVALSPTIDVADNTKLELPSTVNDNTIVTWESDNTQYLNNDGTVNETPDSQMNVILVAKIKSDSNSDITRTVKFTVVIEDDGTISSVEKQ